MEIDEAQKLILDEGLGEDGIVVAIRMGDIPSFDRMNQLLIALETIYISLKGQKMIDRNLALAFHGLTFHIQGNIDNMLDRGIHIPETFIQDTMVRMFLIIESILEDE